MANLKSLAKDTAIYGLSSIVGKFLNYLLVPLYTTAFAADSGEYGIVSQIYAFVALLQVLLICGMETGFFRFANKEGENSQLVYSSILISVGAISLAFLLFTLSFLTPIASSLGYAEHPEFIGIMAIVVALDVFQSIPFVYLRFKQRPVKFVFIKLFNILFGIGLNLFFLIACPWLNTYYPETIAWFYDPGYGVGYVFIANLITSSVQMFFFIPELRGFVYKFDAALMKRIFTYSFPLLVLGVVGILNHTFDKMVLPSLFPNMEEGRVQLGIYSAATKIAMVMGMFTQAFRYAYEPFVFGKSRDSDQRMVYANAMKFFVIFALLAFLAVMFYLDILRYVIAIDYWEGLRVVPIVMAGEIFMGIYFNLSFWYKLIDETRWGAYFSLIGCAIIVSLNVLFVPTYGYMASAWAGVVGYGVITIISYIVGQKKYPIRYELKEIGAYMLLAALLYTISSLVCIDNIVLRLLFRTLLLALFIFYIIKKDLPLSQIPFLGRLIRK
ncbi:lipopolysaccharide biosynthesis protein [Bacteroides sp. 214]|uniref:lipopolysaccharide biosynthesis protein n=1 Tax=Bacteroides sp. 214 TaxID=2302935 RepID=UPI0013D0D0AA|nr:polysaccharide biosynthesis C-terminal domain-containing protein [Bacteroides sp. 214]NDW12106.1 lipopolysaccharide biosynthesis protein [Bacteroides sp. 214]